MSESWYCCLAANIIYADLISSNVTFTKGWLIVSLCFE